jgi:DNA-binding transcriptional LysR family regulator
MTYRTRAAYGSKLTLDAQLCDMTTMDNWDEIRSAAEVARLGTISAAAQSLGVHRATINRHVDSLEQVLGSALFQRHARGYSPTELGRDLLRVADATEEQLSQLIRRAQSYSSGLSGELIITAIEGLTEDLLPALNSFGAQHPEVRIRYICNAAVMKLEYGEAHIAFRAGSKPKALDNVVKLFRELQMGLYATTVYATQYGVPKSAKDFHKHRFVGSDAERPRAPFLAWMTEHVPREQISFASNDLSVMQAGVLSGCGIGFLPTTIAHGRTDLIEVLPPMPAWKVPIWIVTHVDLHRTAKVQGVLEHLKMATGDSIVSA